MRTTLLVIGLSLTFALSQFTAPAKAADSSESSALPPPSYTQAKAHVDSLRFKHALPILEELVRVEPRNADAWNLLAFSQRNLGNIRSARQNYDKALALDPNHKGAHEYLGEMFLILNDLESAQKQLATLASICPQGCDQRDDLRQAIEAYKTRRGS